MLLLEKAKTDRKKDCLQETEFINSENKKNFYLREKRKTVNNVFLKSYFT